MSLLKDADKIYGQFAANIYSDFLGKRYGVKTCSNIKDKTISLIRKEMLDWEKIVNAPCDSSLGFADGSYVYSAGGTLEVPISGEDNVISVNVGGCVIKLKVTNKPDNYVYKQETAASAWVVNHNLNYNPVIRTEDSLGNDIEGTITYNSLNTLTIEFSTAVSGTAYLS